MIFCSQYGSRWLVTGHWHTCPGNRRIERRIGLSHRRWREGIQREVSCRCHYGDASLVDQGIESMQRFLNVHWGTRYRTGLQRVMHALNHEGHPMSNLANVCSEILRLYHMGAFLVAYRVVDFILYHNEGHGTTRAYPFLPLKA